MHPAIACKDGSTSCEVSSEKMKEGEVVTDENTACAPVQNTLASEAATLTFDSQTSLAAVHGYFPATADYDRRKAWLLPRLHTVQYLPINRFLMNFADLVQEQPHLLQSLTSENPNLSSIIKFFETEASSIRAALFTHLPTNTANVGGDGHCGWNALTSIIAHADEMEKCLRGRNKRTVALKALNLSLPANVKLYKERLTSLQRNLSDFRDQYEKDTSNTEFLFLSSINDTLRQLSPLISLVEAHIARNEGLPFLVDSTLWFDASFLASGFLNDKVTLFIWNEVQRTTKQKGSTDSDTGEVYITKEIETMCYYPPNQRMHNLQMSNTTSDQFAFSISFLLATAKNTPTKPVYHLLRSGTSANSTDHFSFLAPDLHQRMQTWLIPCIASFLQNLKSCDIDGDTNPAKLPHSI